MYIVDPTTTGAASCPLMTPVEKVMIGCSDFTVVVSISVSPLKPVDAKSFAGRVHCPSSAKLVSLRSAGATLLWASRVVVACDSFGWHPASSAVDASTAAAMMRPIGSHLQ